MEVEEIREFSTKTYVDPKARDVPFLRPPEQFWNGRRHLEVLTMWPNEKTWFRLEQAGMTDSVQSRINFWTVEGRTSAASDIALWLWLYNIVVWCASQNLHSITKYGVNTKTFRQEIAQIASETVTGRIMEWSWTRRTFQSCLFHRGTRRTYLENVGCHGRYSKTDF